LEIRSKGLAALIDFGSASILDRHWELGSVFHFHGKHICAEFSNAYRATMGIQTLRAEMVPLFSVAVAMHHASRSRLPGKQHRLQRAIEHIQHVIQE